MQVKRRRSFWTKWLAPLVAVPVAIVLYGSIVESNWIEVAHAFVDAPISPALKIAHLTDLHVAKLGRRERRVLAELEVERPDVIVVTGDTVMDGATLPQVLKRQHDDDEAYEQAGEFLKRLKAPLGVYVSRGNWELVRRLPRTRERAFYESRGVRLLVNESSEIKAGVFVSGFDDVSGEPDVEGGLGGMPKGAFVITMFHSPVYFDVVAGRSNLALAGHTHGGQVGIPFLSHFWLPKGSGRFLKGWYEARGSRMYVSRGLGTSGLPFRLLCRPELVILTVGETGH